ncbi:uncharacterized protein LOC125499687 [Athalia rosae]|uniref:uncharacterized protein LOC125499687 n=1 Tax=Athalia rosae TaxID=37344 RepID=UPI002033ED2C|nr:uncharacterized protein LOC125499687 [Athalia rosae]XP_048513030.1 uncharacterized protein LOC125499687 [Athalia rosae]
MVLYSVPWCKNRSDYRNWKRRVHNPNKDPEITFHGFPKDANTRTSWINILGINLPSTPNGARICSLHFEEKSFDRSSPSLVRLKPNAIPLVKMIDSSIDTPTEVNILDSTSVTVERPPDTEKNTGL